MHMELRIAVIGDRNPDYWARIERMWRLPVARYPAVLTNQPDRSARHRACWNAHFNVWEDLRPTVVFEDDAIFTPKGALHDVDFVPGWLKDLRQNNTELAQAEPTMLFHGRQFIDPAGPGALGSWRSGVVPMHMVDHTHKIGRSHAYYINAPACASLTRVDPMDFPWPIWLSSRLALAGQDYWTRFRVYASRRAHVGQRDGVSTITGEYTPELWWGNAENGELP